MQEGYGLNFTVQQCIKQHTKMASFNESSVNTVRVYTYFNSNGEYEILRTVQRFGGKGSVVDNASAGGGYCLIRSDGIVDRNIFRSLSMGKSQLESGVTKEIPSYDKICCATLELHRRLPYFDLIGWDMAVDEDGIPVVLEYNCVAPSIDIPQTAGGPLFSEEELLKLMPKVFNFRNNVKFAVNQISWEDKDNYLWTDDYSFYV
jgi:hypothetical protein